jgi:hypothetical protein
MRWITTVHLKQWAETASSRSALPEVVKKLIRATASKFSHYRFPVGDAAQIPGFDGILLDAKGVPPYIPDGMSVWEVSTESDCRRKANRELEKRTNAPGPICREEATFVFVTPYVWEGLSEWENEHGGGPWKAVKVIDGVALEDWLDDRPTVAADLAREVLSVVPDGVVSTDEWWWRYSRRSQPTVSAALLLAGREQEAQSVLDALGSQPRPVLVQGHSPDEALAFAVGALRSSDLEDYRFLDARSIVVNDPEVAHRIAHRKGLIFFFRSGKEPVDAGSLVALDNHVVMAIGNQAPLQHQPVVRLPRPPAHLFCTALADTMDMELAEAARLTRECAASVTILQRRRPSANRHEPDWCRNNLDRRTLLPALLAGGWDSSNDHDRRIVGLLAGEKYEDFEARLQSFQHLDDAPIAKIGEVWALVAPVDSFELLARYVAQRELTALREVATSVFGEIDPALDLPPEERPYAQLRGAILPHSAWLRDGLAATLLLIAVRGPEVGLPARPDPQEFTNSLIRDLPGLLTNHRLLASLAGQLPLLMEAAPDPFVSALVALLETDDSFASIFLETGLIAPESRHVPLLWGIEVLAWDPARFGQVTRILSALARIDPGGRLGGRPRAVLGAVFGSWPPITDALLAVRLRALDAVLAEEPEVGWKLLLDLLPETDDVIDWTARPRWRAFGVAPEEPHEIHQLAKEAIVERMLARIGAEPARWEAVLAELHNVSSVSRSYLFNLLEGLAQDRTRLAAPEALWSSLRATAARYRPFAAAPWALSAPELERLEALVNRLQPDDLVDRDAWLFDHFVPASLHDKSIEVIEGMRRDALRRIADREGVRGVLRLAQQAGLPGLVGEAAVEVLDRDGLDALLDAELEPSEKQDEFIVALSGKAAFIHGPAWRKHLARRATEERWPPQRLATAMLAWPNDLATWNDVAARGHDVEAFYWSKKPARPLIHATDEVIIAAAEHFGTAERPADALTASAHRADALPSALLISLLDGALAEVAHGKRGGAFLQHLPAIFNELARRGELLPIEIARREFAWLPLLEHSDRSLSLHQLLASEPRFFVELLCEIYQPRPRDHDEEITEERRARASRAYRVLQSWTTLPGTKAGQPPDFGELREWIDTAREAAKAEGRADVADTHIGQLLAHAPSDPDDQAWPVRPVRALLEELAAPKIEEGVATERFNMRGVTNRSVFEGGEQERILAEQIRQWAKASASWPRVVRLLHELAAMWERSGKSQDDRAELYKLRGF